MRSISSVTCCTEITSCRTVASVSPMRRLAVSICWTERSMSSLMPPAWALGHWGWFRFHAPWAMGPETIPTQCNELVALGDQDWATALCLLLQGWHGDVPVTDLSSKLWPALMQRRPRPLDACLASAVLGLWADTAATKPYCEGAG